MKELICLAVVVGLQSKQRLKVTSFLMYNAKNHWSGYLKKTGTDPTSVKAMISPFNLIVDQTSEDRIFPYLSFSTSKVANPLFTRETVVSFKLLASVSTCRADQ
jgi:hypothetical protein